MPDKKRTKEESLNKNSEQQPKKQKIEEWWEEKDGDWYKDKNDHSWYQWNNEKKLWFWENDKGDYYCSQGNSPKDAPNNEWLYYQDDAERGVKIRSIAYKTMREFFQNNFRYSEYRNRGRASKSLVSAHNYAEKQLSEKGYKEVTDEERRNHNIVLGSIRFFDKEGKRIGNMDIKEDLYPAMNLNMRFSKDESKLEQSHSYKDAVKLMDENLKKLIEYRPEILKENANIKNNKVYRKIFKKIKEDLKNEKLYYEDNDIYKAIFQIRNHSEEALIEHVQSEDFRKKFFEQIKSLSEQELNSIKISLYSTKESCHVCQVTLRSLKEFIRESLQEIDVAPHTGILSPPKITVDLHLRSQEETKAVSGGLETCQDLSPLQSQAQEEDMQVEGSKKGREKYTIFYNDIKKELHVLSEKEVSSAHYQELREKYEEQSKEIAELKAKDQQKDERMAEMEKQLQKLLQFHSTQPIFDNIKHNSQKINQSSKSWQEKVKRPEDKKYDKGRD